MKQKLLILALVFSACGYQFQGSGSILPEDVKTVAIPVVENATTETTLGLQLTEALKDRFERYGVVRVVDSIGSADAILNAKITGLDKGVADVTGDTDVELESDVTMNVSAELVRSNGQVLWRDTTMRVSESFASVSDVVVTGSSQFAQGSIGQSSLSTLGAREVSRGQQQAALEELVDEVARKIYFQAVAADF